MSIFKKTRKEKIAGLAKSRPGIVIMMLLAVFLAGYFALAGNGQNNNRDAAVEKAAPVRVAVIDLADEGSSYINTVGLVRPESRIMVTSNARGTIRGINFDVGDEVSANQILATLYDNTTLISLNNAKTNYDNMRNNLNATRRITDESIQQARIGVEAAAESVQAAEVNLKTAQDNLENAILLKAKNNQDARNNAVISFNGFLNTIFTALDQANYIIKAEGNIQLPGIAGTLAAKDTASLQKAKDSYFGAKAAYDAVQGADVNIKNIENFMDDIILALHKTEMTVEDTLTVLDNTVPSSGFSDSALNGQKSSFVALRSTVVNSQSSAESIQQGLENFNLIYNQEITALKNAVSSAETQYEIAKTNYDNALAGLNNAKEGQDQQILSSRTSLDNAAGQYDLAQNQALDLNIKAPISGQITQKTVELGSEVNPGQTIAEISQAQNVKIEVSLPSEDIYRIKTGDKVNITGELTGVISSIDPAADPITKKVGVEIFVENPDNKLITGTFIELSIPVAEPEKTSRDSVFVPLSAVNITQNESYVWLADGSRALKRTVATGKTEGAMIEITQGIQNGDKLVVEGGKVLEEGDLIEIKQ